MSYFNYLSFPSSATSSESDIIVNDNLLLAPLNMKGDSIKTDQESLSTSFIPLTDIYRNHEEATRRLPLRPYDVPYSYDRDYDEFRAKYSVPPPIKQDKFKELHKCSHQSTACSDHVSHTLTCPLCREYFESRIFHLYVIIFILILIIILMKMNVIKF